VNEADRVYRRIAVAATLTFVLLCLPQLHRPYVGDEVDFVKVARALVERGTHEYDRGFIDDVLETTQFQKWVFHPPLYMWVLGLTFAIFGECEVTARGLGMVLGLLSLGLTFGIARRVAARGMSELAGALAVVLSATNPYFIQACLLIDIDGTIFTTLILLLIYMAVRLHEAKSVRVAVLAAAFVATLSAKITTVLLLPPVLTLYDLLRKAWKRALADALVIGISAGLVFLALYWLYARAMGLAFPSLFVHTSLGDRSFGPVSAAGQLLIFGAPILLVLWFRYARVRAARGFVLAAAAGFLAIAAVTLPHTRHFLPQAISAFEGFAFIMVPFCTPALVVLLYAALLVNLRRWRQLRFETVDLVTLAALAIFVGYLGVRVRGGVFSIYHAPALPLIAVCVASFVAGDQRNAWSKIQLRSLAVMTGAALLYGLVMLGDAYFLTKYALLEMRGSSLFSAIARWWAHAHADDLRVQAGFGNYRGYQSYILGVIWYALSLLPVAVAGLLVRPSRELGRKLGLLGAVTAVAVGLGLSTSMTQAVADYRTSSFYGRDMRSIKETAEFINTNVPIQGYYLAPRELRHYIKAAGDIDTPRSIGGYHGRTAPTLNARGELILVTPDSTDRPDALPRQPVHLAIGEYALLDTASTYRVVRQFGSTKVYQYVGYQGPGHPPHAP